MIPTSNVPATARTLEVSGARLHHEVRGEGPLVVLVGAPRDATSFAPLPTCSPPTTPCSPPARRASTAARSPTPTRTRPGFARRRPLPPLTHADAGPRASAEGTGHRAARRRTPRTCRLKAAAQRPD